MRLPNLLALTLAGSTFLLPPHAETGQHCASSARVTAVLGAPGSFRIETLRGVSTARWPAPPRAGSRQEPDYVIQALDVTWDADGSSATVIDTLVVPLGSTVRWLLVAGIHTVTNGRDSADPEAGTKFNYLLDTGNPTFDSTFTDSTVLDFFCYFHEPTMVGRLVVRGQAGPPPPPPLDSAAFAQFLRPPTPNPALGSVTFSIMLPLAAEVELGVFDLGGRRVATIFRGALGPGEHPFTWSGSSDRGPLAPAGRYQVRMRAGSARDGRSFALLR